MDFHINKPITTLESVIRTIHNDNFTYYWFKYLLFQEDVKEALRDNTDATEAFEDFDRTLLWRRFFYILFLVFLGSIIWYRAAVYLYGLILFAGVHAFINKKLKICVKALAEQLLCIHFKREDFQNKTLYQIGSFYSKKYGVPSLIDCICYQDRALRNTILYLPLFLIIIFPLNLSFIEMGILVSLFLYGVYLWSCSSHLYQKLSKR